MPHLASHSLSLFALTLAAFAHAPAAFAQAGQSPPASDELPLFEGDQAEMADGGHEFRFTFGGGYTAGFKSDLDTGGDMSVSKLTAGLNMATDVNPDLTLDFRLNMGVASYDFGGSPGILGGFGGLDPWSDIYTLGFGAAANYAINDDWSVFGGLVLQFSGESGANWGDSINGGGLGGVTYRVNDKLLIGGGLSITSQIEDSVRIFPLIIIQWHIADNWRISNTGPSGGRSSIELTGLELVWTPIKKWEFALGAGSSYSRFRLDDGGVGQDESTPVWLRAGWRPNTTFTVEALAGLAFGGSVWLYDDNGTSLAHSDYDAPFFLGVFGSVKF